MPAYVYRCVDCKTDREVTHSMTEDPEIYCAACDGYCTRVPQVAGISLRGSGFYKNDKATEGI